MSLVFRWLVRLTAFAIALSVLVVFAVYYLASRSLPDYDKTLKVSGITADVEIVRDNSGVPHIQGSSDRDVFFGLGYAHAQDRLWQMTLLRRTAQGRLSELFGARTVETDKLLRRFDLYNLARASVPHQDARTLDALESYAAGVNARIEEINRDSLGRGAPEFFLFDPTLSPWVPADSLAVIKLMALQLSGHLTEEVLRARTSLALGDADRLSDILPDAPGTGVAALPEYATLAPGVSRYAELRDVGGDMLMPVAPRGLAGASNAWAANPERSASGGTLLANDPHLGFTAPAIWYLAQLGLADGAVIGGTIPGVPAVMVGRSEELAWALTSSYVDDQDLFLEELNPDNPEEYRTPDGWKKFETRKSIINIKDNQPVTVTLRWTDNGPVLPATQFDIGTITPKGHVMALGWTALSARDTSMSAAVSLMATKTVEKAVEVSAAYVAPSQNLTLIDNEKIAMQTIGHMPRRDANHQSQGRMPAPGWVKENRWQGTLPYASNPSFVDPTGGIVGNTNNKTVDRPFPLHVSFEWGDTQRFQRWQTLMQGREVHTRESFIEAQLDTVSTAARAMLPLVGKDLWFTGEAAPEGTPERRRSQALTLLANWNGEMNEHLPEALI